MKSLTYIREYFNDLSEHKKDAMKFFAVLLFCMAGESIFEYLLSFLK